MVHRRSIEGQEIVFGVQGALWGNAMTFWDHDTGSIWSQPLGEAIAGPRKGQTLETLPVAFTTWGAWQEIHPDSLPLSDIAAQRKTASELVDKVGETWFLFWLPVGIGLGLSWTQLYREEQGP